MKTVWIVNYDSGAYGSGVSGIFSTKEKSEAFIQSKGKGYTTYDTEEVIVDEHDVSIRAIGCMAVAQELGVEP